MEEQEQNQEQEIKQSTVIINIFKNNGSVEYKIDGFGCGDDELDELAKKLSYGVHSYIKMSSLIEANNAILIKDKNQISVDNTAIQNAIMSFISNEINDLSSTCL